MLIVNQMTRGSMDFYELMGPLFGSRIVAKVVGIHLYDDQDKVWFVIVQNFEVIGCASVRGRVVSDCYVSPDHRLKGLFTQILKVLLLMTKGPLEATCTDMSQWAFKSAGFSEVGKTKNFVKMRLERA